MSNKLLKNKHQYTHTWWGGTIGGEGLIEYEHTFHPSNIKNLIPFRFVVDEASQMTWTILTMGLYGQFECQFF